MARVLALAVLSATAVLAVSIAQARPQAPSPLPGLPTWTAGYKTWFKLNRSLIPSRVADPHQGTKNVYASRRAVRGRYPVGTVIVKEIFRRGQRYPGVIAAMRKVRGRTAHNGWVMIEWTRPSPTRRFGLLAHGAVCYGCHVGAKATDYVFTRR